MAGVGLLRGYFRRDGQRPGEEDDEFNNSDEWKRGVRGSRSCLGMIADGVEPKTLAVTTDKASLPNQAQSQEAASPSV